MTVLWPNGSTTVPRVSSEYGMRFHPIGNRWKLHAGIDLVGWSVIKSPVAGVVTRAYYWGGYGNLVEVRAANGDYFRMAHNARFLVRQGQTVRQGQDVAIMGTTGASTGVHCHFECLPGGGATVNPRNYMAEANASTAGGGGGKPVPPTPKRKKRKMTDIVIYTNDKSDSERSGAIVNFEAGTFSPFGGFPISYANGLAKGFGLEAAAPITRSHYNQIKKDVAAKAARDGKVFVDIADEDVPKIGE